MTKTEFLESFVTRERVKAATELRGDYTAVSHAVLLNGWMMPTSLLTAIKKLFPPTTTITIHNNLNFMCDIAMAVEHPHGKLELSARVLKATPNG